MSIPKLTMLQGDCLKVLRKLPADSVHCCVTSPPYWGLRDYGVEGQLGLEKTPEEYVAKMVEVFREVRRVLREDGTLWLNCGDTYAANRGYQVPDNKWQDVGNAIGMNADEIVLKPKDLCGIPWRLAFALQADGWWLRSEIIWAKRNCMPESVTDRPTKSHEQIFLLAKSQHYFYDAEAVKVPASDSYANDGRWVTGSTDTNYKEGYSDAMAQNPKMPHRVFNGDRRGTVNLRDVWHIPSQPYRGSHFATFPEALVKPCILAGTSERGCCPKCGAPWERVVEDSPEYAAFKKNERLRKGSGMRSSDLETMGLTRGSSNKSVSAETKTTGWKPTCDCGYGELKPCTVLDPFGGSGTTGQVALEYGRNAILIELNPEYMRLINRRTSVTPGLNLA